MSSITSILRAYWFWGVGYVLLMAIVVGVMVWLRGAVLNNPANIASRQAEWQEWRDESARQAQGEGPVRRKARTSQDPPAVIWMRDYFGRGVTMVLLASTAMYIVFVALLRGTLASPSSSQK